MASEKATISSVDEAAKLSAEQAIIAYCSGTFSVGGIMVAKDGTIVKQMHNAVIVDGFPHDPTAHGERQMVDWYYQQIYGGVMLPPPEDLTIVTSLDPCCMCTGAILTAGFRAVTVAEDNTSGINFDSSDTFNTLPSVLRPQAKATFSYPAIGGETCFARPSKGASILFPVGDGVIDDQTAALCEVIFDDTLQTVRDDINHDLPPDKLKNIADLPEDNYIRKAVSDVDERALQYEFHGEAQPRDQVAFANAMADTMRQDHANGGPGEAIALIDPFDNFLFMTSGALNVSKIMTAFMILTRGYAKLRYTLHQAHQADPDQYPEDPLEYLAHPKYCRFLTALSPNESSQSYMGLGAYGSTMEGPFDTVKQYQYAVPRISQSAIDAITQGMPPLYSQIIKVKLSEIEGVGFFRQIIQDTWISLGGG
ncbi:MULTISPECIES: nucleoside deaminase [Sphingomonadales]|uniref:tRNA-specific adenosine deaminase n=1 Tax=Edaphosphingomonas haloaromaticamans TaxID=653954 RepID=A0A1S1HB62_9SPHN|nr:nucleoside deaminase [Sphingomonas haloaromaticamans]OHT18671.1 tRNA-specific adenosine deaminase [Sphingomonas haloaromaticamans]